MGELRNPEVLSEISMTAQPNSFTQPGDPYHYYSDNVVHNVCMHLECGLPDESISSILDVDQNFVRLVRIKSIRQSISDAYDYPQLITGKDIYQMEKALDDDYPSE